MLVYYQRSPSNAVQVHCGGGSDAFGQGKGLLGHAQRFVVVSPQAQAEADLGPHLDQTLLVSVLLQQLFRWVVWDGRARQLVAARDRLGIRHLFYAIGDGKVCFASEIKAILGSGAVERRLDFQALDQVLFMNCPVAPRTMFEGVAALPAGHWLRVQDGQVTDQSYWDLDFAPAEPGTRGEEACREELLALLRTAVQVRTPPGQVTGAYLSGGLDSTTIAALMRENSADSFPCYFVDFGLPAYSERRYADAQ